MASLHLPEPAPTLIGGLVRERDLRRAWLWLAYGLCCAVLLWLARDAFSTLSSSDPDDAMRLQQVRDWLGGQNFYDVSQHRVSPPIGGPMHWSRIVDMPIAGLILLLSPVLGPELAEVIACAAAPLLTLGGLTWALFIATRRIGGEKLALLAALLLLATPTILIQFRPLRIDHHGWQILLGAIALCGAFDPRPARGGAVAGIAIGIWLQISSEGLPYAALFGALFMLRQWRGREQVVRLVAYAVATGGAAVILLALLRGTAALWEQHCDALSSPYVWPLAAFAVATPLAFKLLKPRSGQGRFLAAAASGAAAVVIFLVVGRSCLAGDPFQALGPVAYKLWYLHVMEGRPIWEQSRSMMGLILLPTLVGLAGSIAAARREVEAQRREAWLALAFLLAGSLAIASMVMRAMSLAHVFALPGIGWLMASLFQRAQRQPQMLTRVLGSAGTALLAPAATCTIWIAIAAPDQPDAGSEHGGCRIGEGAAALRRLPASNLFAPLDIGPDILVRTAHSVTGTAHHRNAAGITAVVEGFTAPPERARAILSRLNGGKGPDYLVTCRGLNEFRNYARDHRGSLAAELERGAYPVWLKPVALPRSGGLQLYRVMPDRRTARRH